MPQLALGPQLTPDLSVRDILVEDVTVVMPFYDRLKYFKHYVSEGFWDGFKVQIVCDGSPAEIVKEVQEVVADRPHLGIYQYLENQGVAFARKTGINITETPFLCFCDDDDFMQQARVFMRTSTERLKRRPDLLFSAMPHVYAFDESLQVKLQYDRSLFHEKTGRELLNFLVSTGEMCVLTLGALFETNSLKGIEPESFFKVSEDYVFLARLCARFPERQVYIEDRGAYMRLMQSDSLSSRSTYSLDKLMMHLVSMFVGAHYLMKMDDLRLPVFQQILLKRGEVLQSSYEKGEEAARYMASLIGHRSGEEGGEEFRQACTFIETHRQFLPAEFLKMIG